MLVYHPAFDAYHGAYRMLRITKHHRVIEFAKLRILDYFLCFPADVEKVQLPKAHLAIKKHAREIYNPYRGPISSHRTFRDLEPIQSAAARLLALSGIFSPSALEDGEVIRTGVNLPDSISSRLNGLTDGLVEAYILSEMAEIPLHGIGGLKQRTGFMEYRYDAS